MTILTPFSHYLQSNRAPSEDETRKLKTLRENPLEEISIIDVEIEQIEGILNSLKRKRARIQDSLDDFNTILAPVRRLSTDILGVIFSHCLATHRNPVMRASEAPILLTQICRDWRSIALSIPRLWSKLHIPISHKVRAFLPKDIPEERRIVAGTEEVQKWLRLSAACPLSITLMMASGQISHPPLLDSIIQSSRRWQELEFGPPSSELDVLTRILSLSPDDLCMLQELRIHSLYSLVESHSQNVLEDMWYKSGLLTAPGLRSISIANIHGRNMFPSGIPTNWKNLNHLFIHSAISLGLAHQILTNCCNLVAFLLEIIQWDEWDNYLDVDTPIPLSSCILPYLTFLSLLGDDSSGCNQLLNSIAAPSLQILDFQGSYTRESEKFGLFNFLQKINSLETLRVDPQYLTESNVAKCILTPSVTHLVLGRSPKRRYNYIHFLTHSAYSGNFDFNILHELSHQYSPDSSSTLLFPSLEIFEAYCISGVTDIMLLEFIKARIDATKLNANILKIKKVAVEFSRTRQTDIVPDALAYAQAAGTKLEVDLQYHTGTEKSYIGFDEAWSPSFGISSDDVSWVYPLHDY